MRIDRPLDRVFFTADNHWNHENAIGFCDRPFGDVREMDEEMIVRWNETVGEGDLVFHLGDLTLSGRKVAVGHLRRLRGEIKMLSYPWHHDRRWLPKNEDDWVPEVEFLPPMVVLEVPGLGDGKRPMSITLCHYPMARWEKSHYGAWSLHGHSHGRFAGEGRMMDVGVDACDFRPVSLAEVAGRLSAI